jgi:hypothetical protein
VVGSLLASRSSRLGSDGRTLEPVGMGSASAPGRFPLSGLLGRHSSPGVELAMRPPWSAAAAD